MEENFHQVHAFIDNNSHWFSMAVILLANHGSSW